MKATLLRDFFRGTVPATTLAKDLADAWAWSSSDSRQLRMTDLEQEFTLEVSHLVKLCDEVATGAISAESLEAIGFGILASDHFTWDETPEGERIVETLNDWSCPDVNFALNVETVAKFRHRLLTGEDHFTRADHFSSKNPKRQPPVSRWANDKS